MSKPYYPEKSRSRFYRPPTLIDDFDTFLDGDIPNAVGDFTLLTNWYAQEADGYEPVTIRGEIYPDSTKSRYQNTDHNMNFRASLSSGIKKGDMLIGPDGTIYLLDWEISPQPNNAPSRALRCNAVLEFKRYHPEITDELAYLIEPEGFSTIAKPIPVNAYRYDGRPEYSARASTPGVIPSALTIVSVQYNEQTRHIRDDDEFIWGDDTYVVIDVNRATMRIDGQSGVLTIQARKKSGGGVNE